MFLPTNQIYLPTMGWGWETSTSHLPSCFRIKRWEFLQNLCTLYPSSPPKWVNFIFTSSIVQWFSLGDVLKLCTGIISCHDDWEVQLVFRWARLGIPDISPCATLCLTFSNNSFMEIKFKHYAIHLFKVLFNDFSIFRVVQPTPQSILEHFITPKRNPIPARSHSPFHLDPYPEVTTNVLSVSMDLPILNILQ